MPRHHAIIASLVMFAVALTACTSVAPAPTPTVDVAQTVAATAPPTVAVGATVAATPAVATVPAASPTASLASTIPLLDLAAAWGTHLNIGNVPVAVEPGRVFAPYAITPDAKYLVGNMLDQKNDPVLFPDSAPPRFGLLEVATGTFTEIRRTERAAQRPYTSVEAVDDSWIIFSETTVGPMVQDWTLYAYHRPTGATTEIARAPTDAQGNPTDTLSPQAGVSNGYLVWSEPVHADSPGFFRRVQLRNLATGETRTLTENGSAPAISWPYVAWEEIQMQDGATATPNFALSRIVVSNVETGEQKTLQRPRSPAAFALHGDAIVWITALGRELNLTNMHETVNTIIARSNNNTDHDRFYNPTISERFITWYSNGPPTVYDRALQKLVRLDEGLWEVGPMTNGKGLFWLPKAPQAATPSPEAAGWPSAGGVIRVVDASTLASTATGEVPTAAAATPTIVVERSARLKFLWPAEIPTGLQIVANESSVDDGGYLLALATHPRSQQAASVRAGAQAQPQAQLAPERTTAVTVRGHPGQAFSSGAGYAISWEEDGVPYRVTGGGLDETLAFANSLEEVSGEVWQQRLAEAPQP